jgi:hypothetical protein
LISPGICISIQSVLEIKFKKSKLKLSKEIARPGAGFNLRINDVKGAGARCGVQASGSEEEA